MSHVLFVDDEALVLTSLRTALRRQAKAWDMKFATSGEDALEHLRSANVDVIVSDMRMPGMDGATLLAQVKEEFPSVIRIMLSGHAERDAILRALKVSHQFLSKPCPLDTLRDVVGRACELGLLLQDSRLKGVVAGTTELPTPPAVYQELTRAAEDPDTSLDQLSRIVEQDAALTAKLLQIVNSAYFGLSRPTRKVSDAIKFLGLHLVRTLALTAQLCSVFEEHGSAAGISLDAQREHSLQVALVAKKLPLSSAQQDEAFTAALLADVGQILLAVAMPARMAEIVAEAKSKKRPLHEVEREVLGTTHADIGAYLLGLWGLPLPIVEAVAFHHAPIAAGPRGVDAIIALQVAEALVGEEHVPPEQQMSPDPELLRTLGIPDVANQWRLWARERSPGRAG